MFVHTGFVLHRMQQTIAWQGSTYTFFRPGKNEYGEKNEEPTKIVELTGLFHNGASNHIKVTTSDAGSIIDKSAPYISAVWDKVEKLQLDDQVSINGKTFKVTGKNNIGELNLVGQISLEVVL